MSANEQANVKLTLNGEEAQRELDQVNDRIKKLIELKKKAEAEGDVKGFKKISTELSKTEREAKKLEKQFYDVEKTLKNINGASIEDLQKAERALVEQTKKLNRETDEYLKKREQLKIIRNELASINGHYRQQPGFMTRAANAANKYFNMITMGAAALTGLVFSFSQFVKGMVGLDDALADVMKTTGLTRREVRDLYVDFKYMNTRTPRKELLALAEEAGRLGKTGKKDIQDFVEVANKIKISLGDDLGGNAEEAIREVGKLTEIYRIGNQYGTDFKVSMEKVGSALNSVANNSNASAGYLIEYLKREGGVAVQAKISAANIMGYASTFDQLGQNVEMAATAQSKVLVDMFTDPAKYARIAKMEVGEFAKLLKTNANEAFIKFLEGLNGNNEGLSEMATKLDGLGIDGARATQALAALSSNTKMLREQQVLANDAMEKGTSLNNEYAIKNNNLAGSWERLTTWIHSKFINSGFLGFLEKIVGKTAEWIEQPVEAKLRAEQSELNILIAAISDANTTQENRNDLIAELQKNYPDFLGNLNAEKVTNEELQKRLEDVNKQYEDRILLMIKEDMLQKNYRERTELKIKELDLIKQIANAEKIAAEARKKITPGMDPNSYRSVLTQEEFNAMNDIPIFTAALAENRKKVEELKQSETELNNALGELRKNRTDGKEGETGSDYNSTAGDYSGSGYAPDMTDKEKRDLKTLTDKSRRALIPEEEEPLKLSEWSAPEILLAEELAKKKASEQEWTDFFKKMIDERMAAGEEELKADKAKLEKEKEIDEARIALKTATADAIGKLSGMFASMAKEGSAAQIALLAVEKAAAIASIIVNTLAANQKAKLELGPVAGQIWAITNSITAAASIATIVGTTITDFKDKKNNNVPGYAKGKYPLETGMYGDKPHYALFNEVPGEPEMVVDGKTTRRIRFNYPEIMKAIHAVRDGRQPAYASGKYPDSGGYSSPQNSTQYSVQSTQYSSGLDTATANRLIIALEKFEQKKLVVYTELIKKDLDTLNDIEQKR